jgi:hypothetical protein
MVLIKALLKTLQRLLLLKIQQRGQKALQHGEVCFFYATLTLVYAIIY